MIYFDACMYASLLSHSCCVYTYIYICIYVRYCASARFCVIRPCDRVGTMAFSASGTVDKGVKLATLPKELFGASGQVQDADGDLAKVDPATRSSGSSGGVGQGEESAVPLAEHGVDQDTDSSSDWGDWTAPPVLPPAAHVADTLPPLPPRAVPTLPPVPAPELVKVPQPPQPPMTLEQSQPTDPPPVKPGPRQPDFPPPVKPGPRQPDFPPPVRLSAAVALEPKPPPFPPPTTTSGSVSFFSFRKRRGQGDEPPLKRSQMVEDKWVEKGLGGGRFQADEGGRVSQTQDFWQGFARPASGSKSEEAPSGAMPTRGAEQKMLPPPHPPPARELAARVAAQEELESLVGDALISLIASREDALVYNHAATVAADEAIPSARLLHRAVARAAVALLTTNGAGKGSGKDKSKGKGTGKGSRSRSPEPL